MSGSAMAVRTDAETIRERFHSILMKANKNRPRESDIKAPRDLLDSNKELRLWEAVVGMGELAESKVLDTIVKGSGQGMRECWRRRLKSMRADLDYAHSSALERLLIQQVTLCWLNLNLVEYRHNDVIQQSISLAQGIYWEKRLSMAQRRFTRAGESLARMRRLSRRIPVQVNIAAQGGQQINVASEP